MVRREKTVIGRTASAAFPAEGIHDVPVKIDTGADSSSIWASGLYIDDDNLLNFVLFDASSPYYSGKTHSTKHYSAHLIRSSNGLAQVRYRVSLQIVLADRKISGSFTLADRSQNAYPVLVGCKLLNRKFIVDVSMKSDIKPPNDAQSSLMFDEELHKDPKAFFEKYHQGNQRGDIAL